MKAWQLPLIAATASLPVHAVQPQGISLGSGVLLLPGVEISILNDSNIYFSEDDETSSRVTKIRPSLALLGDLGTTQLYAYYELENGSYSEDSDDNYLDQFFFLGTDVEMTSRQALGLDFSIKAGHDPRGTGSTQGVQNPEELLTFEPDEFKEIVLGADYTYGADSAFANVTGYIENYSKSYSTNKELTSVLEHDKLKLGALASFKVSSATKALVEVQNTTISYSDGNIAAKIKEGSESKILAGGRWDFAGKTSGEVKLGVANRSFDESENDSDSRFSWEANVTWTPRTYSVLNLFSSQEARETSGGGSHVASSLIAASWDHQFSTRFGLNASLSSFSEEYVNPTSSNRDDSTLSYGIKGIFSPNKMLDLSLGIDNMTRDSSENQYDYDRQLLTLSVKLAI